MQEMLGSVDRDLVIGCVLVVFLSVINLVPSVMFAFTLTVVLLKVDFTLSNHLKIWACNDNIILKVYRFITESRIKKCLDNENKS